MRFILKDIPKGVLVRVEDIDVEYVIEGKIVKELGEVLVGIGNSVLLGIPGTKEGANKYKRYLACLLEYWKGQRDACQKILSGESGDCEKLLEYSETRIGEIDVMLKKARDGG